MRGVEQDDSIMKVITDNRVFGPKTAWIIFCILTFIYCFFLWWWVPIRFAWEHVRFWLIVMLVKMIVRLTTEHKTERAAKVLDIVKKIAK